LSSYRGLRRRLGTWLDRAEIGLSGLVRRVALLSNRCRACVDTSPPSG
jgi:hypothetical protein